MGICARSFRRYVDRFEEEGLDGLIDKRIGEVSQRKAPVDEVLRMEALYKERYEGWTVDALLRALSGGAPRDPVVQLGEEPAAGGWTGFVEVSAEDRIASSGPVHRYRA